MNHDTILVGREASSLIITLNRPERRNAISLRMMDEIAETVASAAEDNTVRTLILTGGETFFSSGADLTEAIEVSTPTDAMAYFGKLHRLAASLESLGKPVIAAIEGFCLTGGCELALACDVRVAADGASFAITSSRIGTVPGAGGTQRLPRIVGMPNALEMLFAAEPLDCAEARRIGLINRKVAKGQALQEALAMGKVYADRAPLSLALVKQAVRRGMQMNLTSALDFEISIVTTIYGTQDKQEGISAFLEKRQPNFTGR